MNPKTAPQFEAFGSSLFALIRYYKDSKMYPTLIASFLKSLCSNPAVPEELIKSLEQAIVEAQNKFLEAQREPKKVVKPKQQVSAKALKDADSSDEEEAGGNSQLYSESDVATAAAKRKQEEQQAAAEAKRVKEAAEEAARRREENERALAAKQRTVNDDAVKNDLASQGFEVLAPAAWDKKGGKGGKGRR